MSVLKREIVYAGLEKDRFDALKPLALEDTRKSLKVYSLLAVILFAALASLNWLSEIASMNGLYYTLMAAFSGVVYLCVAKDGPAARWLTRPLAYATIAALYTVSIILTLIHPELPAVTFIAVLLLTPFLFSDSPVYIICLDLAATLAFCLLCLKHKDRSIALDDCWNAISFCLVSAAIAVMQRKLRFKALAQGERLRYLSETDIMTGARNRNMFERISASYGERCRVSLTCVYVDVNGLHALNNAKGHKAGDVMLQTVAKALLERFGGEHVYRIGGDEFFAFAPDQPEDRVRQDMQGIGEALSAQSYDISVGVASAGKADINFQHLMAEAEREMYQQKRLYYQQPGRERRGR